MSEFENIVKLYEHPNNVADKIGTLVFVGLEMYSVEGDNVPSKRLFSLQSVHVNSIMCNSSIKQTNIRTFAKYKSILICSKPFKNQTKRIARKHQKHSNLCKKLLPATHKNMNTISHL